MNNNTEVIKQYTAGEITLEEANAKLVGIKLNPEKNTIKPEEVGHYGLLDTGTATLDKVEVKDGKLVNCDCGEMYALCIFNGKTYKVKGDTLVE